MHVIHISMDITKGIRHLHFKLCETGSKTDLFTYRNDKAIQKSTKHIHSTLTLQPAATPVGTRQRTTRISCATQFQSGTPD